MGSDEHTSIRQRFLDKYKWTRIVFVIFFAVLFAFLHFVISVTTLVQIVLTLFSKKVNNNIQDFGKSLSLYAKQVIEFQTAASDNKPFPFEEWPTATVKSQITTRPKKARTTKATPSKAKGKTATTKTSTK